MCILKGIADIFLGIGLLTLTIGVFFGLHTRRLLKQGVRAPGVVVENVVEERADYDRDDHSHTISRTYRPKVRFRSQNGEEVVFVSHAGFGQAAYRQGEAVEVLYDPADPHSAEINGFWSLWLGPTLIGLIGLVPLLVGVGIWVWLSRLRAPASGGGSPADAFKRSLSGPN
jgi:hypothetical protein